MGRLTAAQRKLFISECERRKKQFELSHYYTRYEISDDAPKPQYRAWALVDGASYNADIGTRLTRDEEESGRIEETIKEDAKHEMIHVLLGRFRAQARARFISEDELTEAEEELVRKLEGIIPD